jgi:hypothetical protein
MSNMAGSWQVHGRLLQQPAMEFSACLCGEKRTMAGMAAFFKTSTKESRKGQG